MDLSMTFLHNVITINEVPSKKNHEIVTYILTVRALNQLIKVMKVKK